MGKAIATTSSGGSTGRSLFLNWQIDNTLSGATIDPIRFPLFGSLIDFYVTIETAAGSFATTFDILCTHTDPTTMAVTTFSIFDGSSSHPFTIPSSVSTGYATGTTSFGSWGASFIPGDILTGVVIGDGTAQFTASLRVLVSG